jgi:predicted neuraminidase
MVGTASLFLSAAAAAAATATTRTSWTIVPNVNAVPSGKETAEKDLAACEAKAAGHSQFSFNLHSKHCYVSDATTFGGAASDHITSGCDATKVSSGCAAPAPTPPAPSPPAPSPPPAFDGIVRNQTDGSAAAYLIPPYKSNHASTIEVLPDGTLAAAWFSGAAEEADLCAIVFATLPAGSTRWSAAATLSQQKGFSNQNPVLFYDGAAKLLRLYHSHAPAKSGEGASVIFELSSSDGGATWTPPALSKAGAFPGAFPRNRIIPALDGGLLFPIYDAGDKNPKFKANFAIIDRSSADAARANWTEHDIAGSANLVQPTVVRLPDKSLRAWFRDRKKVSIYTAASIDDAATWSAPVPAGLPNPNVGIEANILANGHVVMVFNDYNGANASKYGRTPLNIALSLDGGRSWPHSRPLQVTNDGQPAGPKVEFSYPSVLQTAAAYDGAIHVVYTYDRGCIKYRRVTEEWIIAGEPRVAR